MGGGVASERERGELLMAKTFRQYHRNYSASDTTNVDIDYYGDPTASIEEIGWEAPTGYVFSEWNSSQDGNGTAYQVGETAFEEALYAIWTKLAVPYLTNDTDLTAVADAIREKGGTSEALAWPQGYVDAIGAISGGGGGPILNPLCGAEMFVENGSVTYQYEFDPLYGKPYSAYVFEIDWMGMSVPPPSIYTARATFDNSTSVLTISNSGAMNAGCVFVIEFLWGDNPGSGYMANPVWFDWVKAGLYYNPCYLRGTLITLADGTQKPVEEVSYDDELLVWDFDEGRFSSAKPLWIKRPQKKVGYHRLKLESGKTLDVVGTDGKAHRLLDTDAGEFVWSTDMVGHRTMTLDGDDRLVSCEWAEEPCEYYNIVTERHINCYANGILTSCRYNNVYPIRDMRFVKEQRESVSFEAYDVPRKWYDGLRLAEQTIPIADTNEYVRWRVENDATRI